MSLIKCPDCNKEISSYAPACPNCGRPKHSSIHTIEQTGKKFKKTQLIYSMMVALGMIMVFIGMGTESAIIGILGFILIVIGITGYIVSKVGAWWEHG